MSGGFHRFRLGALEVTELRDGNLPAAPGALRGIAEDAIARVLAAEGADSAPSSDVNVVAVRHGDRLAVIDTGAGPFMTPRVGHLPASMEAAGIDPAAVDTVLLTHLHPDHAYGLADAAGTPLFPRARLLVSAAEAAFWLRPGAQDAAPENQRRYFPQILASLAPYRDRMDTFDAPAAVFPCVTAVPLPGHTPGHTGFRLRSGADGLLVWGDIVHVPELQARHPEVTVAFDVDPAAAVSTRRTLLAELAESGEAVIGMHTRFPGPFRVRRAAQGFRLTRP